MRRCDRLTCGNDSLARETLRAQRAALGPLRWIPPTALGLRTEAVHPRTHDLRHSFAVSTLIGWQRSGVHIDEQIAVLCHRPCEAVASSLRARAPSIF